MTTTEESADRRLTVADVRAMPANGVIRELVDDALLVRSAPSWAHQRAALFLYRQLYTYVRGENSGDVLVAPADISPDSHTLVQPDVFVVTLTNGKRPDRWTLDTRLLLAVEVVSPGSRKQDYELKGPIYQRMGADYWIVDVESRVVECRGARDQSIALRLSNFIWRTPASDQWVQIDVRAMFEEAHGG